MRIIALPCWHSRTEWHILCFTTVTVPLYQWNDMKGDFCAVLFTCGVAAWTDCWLCDSVQKYCCTVTGGGDFVNWTKSNCSCISSPPTPAYHFHCHRHHRHYHHHHYHILIWFTNCVAERQNMYKAHTMLYTLYILQYIYRYISLSSS